MTSLLTTHCRRQLAIFFRKMAAASSSSTLMVAMAFLTVFFSSVSPGAAIKCWECNSEFDMRCGERFDNFSVALVDCDQRKANVDHIENEMLIKYNEYTDKEQNVENFDVKKASVCRKTTQIVDGNTRVVRGCGWIRNTGYLKDRKCFMRTGTHQVLVYHCSCNSDGCNPASRPAAFSTTTTSLIAMLTLTALPLLPSCLFMSNNNLWNCALPFVECFYWKEERCIKRVTTIKEEWECETEQPWQREWQRDIAAKKQRKSWKLVQILSTRMTSPTYYNNTYFNKKRENTEPWQ